MDISEGEPRTLATALRALDDDALAALLRTRPDLAAPLPPDLVGLAARAGTRTSVLRATDRLDAAGWFVLQGLLVLETPTTYEELRSILGSPPDDQLRAAFGRLRTMALVWGPDSALRMPKVLADLGGDYPAGLGPPAYRLLLSQPPSRVASIAALLELERTGELAADAAAISASLATPETVSRLLGEIDDEAEQALRQMTWGPPIGRVPQARRELGPPETHGSIDQLLARGLLVPAGNDRVVMPREVGLHLRGGGITETTDLLPPALVTVQRDVSLVDRTASGAAGAFVGHVGSLLERWGQDPPSELRAGGLSVRDVRAAGVTLSLDETEVALVAEVAYAAGLVVSGGDVEPVWLPTAEYDRWRALGTAAQWAHLAVAWLSTSRVPGLAGSRDDRDRRLAPLGPDLTRGAAASVRLDVLTSLAAAPPGAAPDLDSLAAAVAWHAPRRGGALQRDLVGWTIREASQLGVVGMGSISSQGRAMLNGRIDESDQDPGTPRTGRARRGVDSSPSVSAEIAAAAVLAPLLPPPVDYVFMQADLTAVAPGPLVPELAAALAQVGEVESTGGATVYRFTAGSMRRAFDAGRSAEDIHRLLAAASRTPVPQPLTYLVDDVARRHGGIRVSTVKSVVRVTDDAAADQLLNDRTLVGLGLRRLASTVLSSDRPAQNVVDVMRESGHSPVIEGSAGEVLVAEVKTRRASLGRRTRRVRSDLDPPSQTALEAAVRTLRAGERVAAARDLSTAAGAARPPLVPRRPVDTIALLTDALIGGQPVWIGYVDNNGSTSERLVDPIRVEGGSLTAYDHLRDDVRTFAAHRITGVAVVDDEPEERSLDSLADRETRAGGPA